MHTFESQEVPGIVFVYHGDMAGEVKIIDHRPPDDDHDKSTPGERVTMPMRALLEFVACCYVAPRRITVAENAGYQELLK